jgi:serine/threonine protein kinase/Tol biopolymer transport system component
MMLDTGARLGPYEILSPIGAGGMGEVYRARDTRLGRAVALKLLPKELARDAVREARFEREARSASALSHANVVAVYDVGREGESLYLVTELVEGGNLRDLLDRGPVPVKRALELAAQIAAGLAAAHEQGIVHRDLKPENILLTKAGEAKIADFGLAKLAGPDTDADSRLPTSDGLKTSEGMIMGTVAYMSPEQASGRSVDFRSDQFSFGSVLYELLTERSPFRRASAPETLAAILRDEPEPLERVNPSVPAHVSWILERCLAREPEQRYASTRDLARELALVREHLSDLSEQPVLSAETSGRRDRRSRLPRAVAIIAIVAAAGMAALWWIGRQSHEPRSVVRFSVPPPAAGDFFSAFDTVSLALSPDGSRLAFIAGPPEATRGIVTGGPESREIWIRSLSALEPQPVAGTEGATSLFWSPDGKSIGFFTKRQLKRIGIGGGSAIPLCGLPGGTEMAGTWGDGQIVFASTFQGVIYRISADGGTAVPIVRPEAGETRAMWPWFLPDGKSFLYVAGRRDGDGELKIAPAGGAIRDLGRFSSRVEYADPGFLVFAKEGALYAQRFDVTSARLSGPMIPLAPKVHEFYTSKWAAFATSRGGTLAYSPAANNSRLTWFDRSGRKLGEIGAADAGDTISLEISADGRQALFDRTRLDLGTYDVWRVDLERGIETRVTSDPNTEVDPIWLPGGRQIIYSAVHEYLPQLVRRNLAGGPETPLLPPGTFQEARSVTPDGKQLLFTQTGQGGTFGLWSLPLAGGAPTPIIVSGADQAIARLSPDGKWIAFISNDSGNWEAYVAPFQPNPEKVRLSNAGALSLAWSRDGRNVFFTSPDHRLFAVDVRTAPSLQVGDPRPLFSLPGEGWTDFDVAPDGRFLAAVRHMSDIASPLSVVVNWTAELPR